MQIHGLRHVLGAVLAIAMVLPVCAKDGSDSPSQEPCGGFRIAPEYHFDEDVHFFFNQKDSTFKRLYFVEWNTFAELAFFSIDNRFFFFFDMQAAIDLGRWPDKAILFDPNQVDIGFGPTFEYRFNRLNVALGLDHHCFHQIDTLVTAPDFGPMYWNKLMLSVSSPQFRPEAFREAIGHGAELTRDRRIAWQAGIAYTLHDFFGMDTSIVGWNQVYMIDLTGEARCAAFRFKGFAAILDGKTGAYFTRTNQTLWNQQLRAELLATEGKFGLDLFVNWVVVDQLQKRLNKDRLVAIGIDGFR